MLQAVARKGTAYSVSHDGVYIIYLPSCITFSINPAPDAVRAPGTLRFAPVYSLYIRKLPVETAFDIPARHCHNVRPIALQWALALHRQGLSQAAIAAGLSIGRTTVGKIVRGEYTPQDDGAVCFLPSDVPAGDGEPPCS
jgi:hypothetical protein